jgi:hypothetical protein
LLEVERVVFADPVKYFFEKAVGFIVEGLFGRLF